MSGSGLTPICRIQLLLLLRSRCKNLPVPKPSNLCMFRFMIRILRLPHLTIYICLVSREAAAYGSWCIRIFRFMITLPCAQCMKPMDGRHSQNVGQILATTSVPGPAFWESPCHWGFTLHISSRSFRSFKMFLKVKLLRNSVSRILN